MKSNLNNMKQNNFRMTTIAVFTVAFLVACGSLRAAEKTITLKLGTLAPLNTSYHKSLLAMGDKWRQASGGSVKLNIYAGGTLGGEADMVGLMQTGSLDAGLVTAIGLSEIDRDVLALQAMPLAFRSLDEVDYVGEKLRPMLEQRLLAKGYLVLFWSDSGWVRFFSKKHVLLPDDLRKQKIFCWAGNVRESDVYKASGFNPVSLETAAIPQALMSGTVEAVPMPPFFALAARLGDQTKYMLELNWAPLVGAAIVRKKSWDRLPSVTREALLKIASETGKKVKADGRAESEAAVATMVKHGLQVQKVSPEVEAQWRAVVAKVENQIRGKIVPADMYDEAQKLLKEYRATHGEKPK